MNNYQNTFKLFGFLLLVFTLQSLTSKEISPNIKIKTSGAITDFLIENTNVILSTDVGTIETYNLGNGNKVDFLKLPEMKDFMGESIPTKVYSIDKRTDQLLIVTQGNNGFRNVSIIGESGQRKLIDADADKMLVKKARFIGDCNILLGLLSNELILFDIEKMKVVFNLSISSYTFSDFNLSEDKKFAFTSDESGIVHKIDIKQGKIVEEFSGNNVDNVYKLVYQNGTIITAGQDRRVGFYQTFVSDKFYLQKDFLVYCVGLSQKGTIGAFTADEENSISLFDVSTKTILNTLIGHKSLINKIEFVDEKTLVSASDDQFLMIWKLE